MTSDLSMTGYWGGNVNGQCVQLTFNKPSMLHGEKHCNFSNDGGVWYLNLTKSQALELATALVEFANGKRPEKED